MKLKDRISNIKKLLMFCPNHEVELIDKVSGEFFRKLTETDKRFKSTPYDYVYVTIRLATHILNKENKFGLLMSYCYDNDRDGEEWEDYYFDDPEVTYEYDFLKPSDNLKYSDIPDYIWQIIQEKAHRIASEEFKKEEDDIFRRYEDNLRKWKDFRDLNLEKD